MQPQLYVPPLSAAQQQSLCAGLKSNQAFTVRRCQILLASAEGRTPQQIAVDLRCTSPTVRNAIHAFEREGLTCLQEKSSRPRSVRPILDASFAEPLRELLHQTPRKFGKTSSLWTLDSVAEVVYAKGWTPRQLSGECIRLAFQRLGLSWLRAKHWITSPDPAYARKKKPAIA